jgi:hypothetical protein
VSDALGGGVALGTLGDLDPQFTSTGPA